MPRAPARRNVAPICRPTPMPRSPRPLGARPVRGARVPHVANPEPRLRASATTANEGSHRPPPPSSSPLLNAARTSSESSVRTMHLIEKLEQELGKRDVPAVHVGDTVEVHYLIREGDKERVQLFIGTIIAEKNRGIRRAVT